jgi:hypothetical protein
MRIPLLSKLRVAPERRGCRHVNADGRSCKANRQRGREYCFFHDPDPKLREKRQAANRAGGAHSRRRKRKRAFNPLQTPAQLGSFLRELMNDVRNGDVGVRKANALARLTPLILGTMEQETKRIELEKYDTGVPHSRPSASGNNYDQARVGQDVSLSNDRLETGNLKPVPAGRGLETASQPLPGKDALDDTEEREAASIAKQNEDEERRTRQIAEHKKLQEVQMKLYGVCSPDLDFNLPAQENRARPGDLARKKLDAQDLERKKELAYALAPTTMKYSMFNEEGLVVEKPTVPTRASRERGTQARASTPTDARSQLDYDNQPSPIPGLQNRHLNYQKYMGAPVSYLKRLGFVFPRQRWRLW